MTNVQSSGSKNTESLKKSLKTKIFKKSEAALRRLFKTGTPTTLVLIVVLLGVPLLSVYFYTGVNDRVIALRGSAEMLDNTLSNTNDPRGCVNYWIIQGVNASRTLNSELQSATTYQEVDTEAVKTIQEYLYGNVFQSNYFAGLSCDLAQDLVAEELSLEEKGFEAKGTSFKPVLAITQELLNTTKQLNNTFGEIIDATEDAKYGGALEMGNLRIKGVELTSHYYRAQATIAAALTTLAAGDVSILAPFLLVTILYAVFLLFPWILMSLFFQKKQIDQIKIKKQTFKYLQYETDDNIREKAFRDREYIVSLILLTVITGVLFYFFFYPYATAGFGRLISSGGGVKAFADYLVNDATPITFGFVGAYFYIINMLLRRYFAADLNPNPYTFAVVRLLTVFILSVILQLAASVLSEVQFVVSMFAFVVGIFPDVGLKWITRTVNEAVKKVKAPEIIDRDPLTKLDGLNIWHEARFLEEKIENVQNLATASLEELIINTNFYPAQLMDWVDQAILFIHTHELWKDAFHSVGIRTATDLLCNTKNDKNQFDEVRAEKLAVAINAAQALNSSDKEHPRNLATVAATDLLKSIADVLHCSYVTYKISSTMDERRIETIDSIEALKIKVENAQKLGLSDNLVNLKEIEQKLVAKDNDSVKKAKDAIGNVERSSTELTEALAEARQVFDKLDRKKPETLVNIETAHKNADQICRSAASLIANVNASKKIVKEGSTDEKTKNELNDLYLALDKTQEISQNILKEAQKMREDAGLLDKDKPDTIDRVTSLQTHLIDLQKLVNTSDTKLKEAKKVLGTLQGPQLLLNETHKKFNSTQLSLEELTQLTTNAKDVAASLSIDSKTGLVGLSELKDLIEKVWKKAEEVKNEVRTSTETLSKVSAPPTMTKDILSAIVSAIDKGPNIQYLINFWNRVAEESKFKPNQTTQT